MLTKLVLLNYEPAVIIWLHIMDVYPLFYQDAKIPGKQAPALCQMTQNNLRLMHLVFNQKENKDSLACIVFAYVSGIFFLLNFYSSGVICLVSPFHNKRL